MEACRLRLRPILMTSLAFTLGVMPLYLAVGAGAEMRIALGTAVFWGMIGVTLFGLIFTPVFYVVIRRLTGRSLAAPRRGGGDGAAGGIERPTGFSSRSGFSTHSGMRVRIPPACAAVSDPRPSGF